MKGYDARPAEHNDFISHLRTALQDKDWTSLEKSPHEGWEVTMLTSVKHGKGRRYKAHVANQKYKVQGVVFLVSQGGSIREVNVPPDAVVEPVQVDETKPVQVTHQRSSSDVDAEIRRMAQRLAQLGLPKKFGRLNKPSMNR